MRYIQSLLIISFATLTSKSTAWTSSCINARTTITLPIGSSTMLRVSNASSFLHDIDPLPTESTASSHHYIGSTDQVESIISPYLIHKGRAVVMIKRCVSIEGLSLSTGWTPQATECFKLAIEAVVRANPILTGKLIEKKKLPWPWSSQSELWISPNEFPVDTHSFVKVVKPDGILSPGNIVQDSLVTEDTTKDLFEHVYSSVAPYLLSDVEFSADQIEIGSPLFEAKIMDFGDGMAAYSIKLSHAIGDGTTYFQLVSQISSFMNGRTPSPIDWNNPLKATHEIYPTTFSERDYKRSYGLPFGWGIFKNLRTLFKRKCQYILLSKDKIAHKKKSLNVSANDIIMSCLCEMCGSSDIFAFDKSVRGIKDGVPKGAAGNFFIEIPFDVENGKDPSEIHKIGKDGYFGTNSIPLLPFLNGRVGRITSLASITHQANFPGSDVVCQFPSASFIKDLPLDVAVIFRFDKNHWGIMHNFRKLRDSPLLDEIIA